MLTNQEAKTWVEEPTPTSNPNGASNPNHDSISYDKYVPKPKAKKKTSDPKMPKRPKTAYIQWVSENCGRIRIKMGTPSNKDLSVEIGRQWKQLPKLELKK